MAIFNSYVKLPEGSPGSGHQSVPERNRQKWPTEAFMAFGDSNGIVMAHIQGDCCSCLGGQQQPETLGHTGWTWQIEQERGCKQAAIDRAIASEKTRTRGLLDCVFLISFYFAAAYAYMLIGNVWFVQLPGNPQAQ